MAHSVMEFEFKILSSWLNMSFSGLCVDILTRLATPSALLRYRCMPS